MSLDLDEQGHGFMNLLVCGLQAAGLLRFQLTKTVCLQGTHVAVSYATNTKRGGCREHTKSLCFCSEIAKCTTSFKIPIWILFLFMQRVRKSSIAQISDEQWPAAISDD